MELLIMSESVADKLQALHLFYARYLTIPSSRYNIIPEGREPVERAI